MSVLRGNSTFIKSCPLGRQCFLPGWCPRSRSSRMSAGGLGHQCVSGSGSSCVLYFTVTCLSCSEHGNQSIEDMKDVVWRCRRRTPRSLNRLLVTRHFSWANWGAESVSVELMLLYMFLVCVDISLTAPNNRNTSAGMKWCE